MRNPIYTDTKLAGPLREQLKKMLLEKQEAMIKKSNQKEIHTTTKGCGINLLPTQLLNPTKIWVSPPNQNCGIYLWY